MSNEQRKEIIKSFAFGMPPEDVAKLEDISLQEAEQIFYDEADLIAHKKNFLNYAMPMEGW